MKKRHLARSGRLRTGTSQSPEISHKLSIYKNAVTQKGMDTYKSLQEQMKKIKREEEMYKLQKHIPQL